MKAGLNEEFSPEHTEIFQQQ